MDSEDIEEAKSDELNPNIISIPTEKWEVVVDNIEHEEQPWWNSIDINVENINTSDPIELETLTNKLISPDLLDSQNRVTVSQLMTDSEQYNGITKESTLEVKQPITTSNFQTIDDNNTYTLTELYQGSDNPIGFKPDSSITVNVQDPTVSSTDLTLTLTQNQTTPITVNPSDYNVDYFDQVKYTVNVTPPTYPTVTFNTITSNNTYTLSQLTTDQSEYFSKNSTITANINTKPIVYKIKSLGINKEVKSEVLVRNMVRVNSGNSMIYYGTDPTITLSLNNSGIFYCIFNTSTFTTTAPYNLLYWNFGSTDNDNYIAFYDINENKLFEVQVYYDTDKLIGCLNHLFDLSYYNSYWKLN